MYYPVHFSSFQKPFHSDIHHNSKENTTNVTLSAECCTTCDIESQLHKRIIQSFYSGRLYSFHRVCFGFYDHFNDPIIRLLPNRTAPQLPVFIIFFNVIMIIINFPSRLRATEDYTSVKSIPMDLISKTSVYTLT